jgi:DNA-binding MarR family transcriptional regulator
VHERDHVDEILEQWRRERPDLRVEAMGTLGRLGRLATLATRAIEGVLAEHGLAIGEFDVLAGLRRQGEPFAATPGRLAQSLMLSPAAMTNRLDRLEAAGLVERRRQPGDRRQSPVALTAPGRERVDAAVTDHVAHEERLLAGLSARDRRTLDQLLRTLLATVDPTGAGGALPPVGVTRSGTKGP